MVLIFLNFSLPGGDWILDTIIIFGWLNHCVPTFKVPILLKGLQTRINNIIVSLSPETGVFVKLTTRLPKDSTVAIAKVCGAFLTKLSSLGKCQSANDRLALMVKVMT